MVQVDVSEEQEEWERMVRYKKTMHVAFLGLLQSKDEDGLAAMLSEEVLCIDFDGSQHMGKDDVLRVLRGNMDSNVSNIADILPVEVVDDGLSIGKYYVDGGGTHIEVVHELGWDEYGLVVSAQSRVTQATRKRPSSPLASTIDMLGSKDIGRAKVAFRLGKIYR